MAPSESVPKSDKYSCDHMDSCSVLSIGAACDTRTRLAQRSTISRRGKSDVLLVFEVV